MIMLGNLSVEQMEKRLGIALKDEDRDVLSALRENVCNKVAGNDKIHIHDIPFFIVCGTKETYDRVIALLTPYANEFNATLQIAIAPK